MDDRSPLLERDDEIEDDAEVGYSRSLETEQRNFLVFI